MTVSRIVCGDALDVLRGAPSDYFDCCVTSPPYWGLRDYKVKGQMGLERTPERYVERLVRVLREVRRCLKPDGTLWLVIGDAYAGSWGAQSRPDGSDEKTTLRGRSMLSARQIAAHPRETLTGSTKLTPGIKPKDLVGIPWMVAFALRADGWWLRSDIVWSKPNVMPLSVRDRCTTAHEYVFMLSKSRHYYYDWRAVAEPCVSPLRDRAGQNSAVKTPRTPDAKRSRRIAEQTVARCGGIITGGTEASSLGFYSASKFRNRRDVWTVATSPYRGAHFATFPPALVEPCVKAGCRPGGTVLDPFSGAGTTALVAKRLRRSCYGIELNPEYVTMSEARVEAEPEGPLRPERPPGLGDGKPRKRT